MSRKKKLCALAGVLTLSCALALAYFNSPGKAYATVPVRGTCCPGGKINCVIGSYIVADSYVQANGPCD